LFSHSGSKSYTLEAAAQECVKGSLTFNGQRCTAIKIIFVHEKVADQFLARLCDRVDALPFGLPWEKGVQITPLAEPQKVERLQQFVEDAKKHGARVANTYGGLSHGTFFFPAVAAVWSAALFGSDRSSPSFPFANWTRL
jgi:glyceraldehyde-3-phosphate dehydrogenase (NADP+)